MVSKRCVSMYLTLVWLCFLLTGTLVNSATLCEQQIHGPPVTWLSCVNTP
jgi:hypothetical protein